MVMEPITILLVTAMRGNGKTINILVKELFGMLPTMKKGVGTSRENGWKIHRTELCITKTGHAK